MSHTRSGKEPDQKTKAQCKKQSHEMSLNCCKYPGTDIFQETDRIIHWTRETNLLIRAGGKLPAGRQNLYGEVIWDLIRAYIK